MGFFDFLTGGDSKTDDINYPKWQADGNFDATQEFLNNYSKDLLTKGPNDYYKPIGEYGTPEFFNFLNQGNATTLNGVNAALAKTGRARGGRVGEVAAQELGDTNAKLLYADYLRAMQGRQGFFDTGLNVQANVRDAGFQNQGARNTFNVNGAQFDMDKAIYGDGYDRQQGMDLGKTIGTVAGGVGGFMLGGPAGAMAGAGLGGDVFGGGGQGSGVSWIDAIMSSKGSGQTPGVSNLGKINMGLDAETLSKLFSNN